VALFGDPPGSDRTSTMQIELKPRPAETAGGVGSEAMDETSELALLAEFMRAKTVAALAGDIAERLGAGARGDDLIAAADLIRVRPTAERGGDPRPAQSRVRAN
jgi:hypothetical protein